MSQREAGGLRVQISEAGQIALLRVAGQIDSDTVQSLDQALQPFQRQDQRLILDLRDLLSIESSGLQLLMAVGDELEARGGQLRVIVQPGSQVERTLELAGLHRRLPVFHTSPEAVAGQSLRK